MNDALVLAALTSVLAVVGSALDGFGRIALFVLAGLFFVWALVAAWPSLPRLSVRVVRRESPDQ